MQMKCNNIRIIIVTAILIQITGNVITNIHICNDLHISKFADQ